MMFRSIENFSEDRKEALYEHWDHYFVQQKDKLRQATAMDYEAPETKLEYKKIDLPCPMLNPSVVYGL